MDMRPVGAEVFHKDGQTDGRTDTDDEANSRFSQILLNAPKNLCCDGKSPVKIQPSTSWWMLNGEH